MLPMEAMSSFFSVVHLGRTGGNMSCHVSGLSSFMSGVKGVLALSSDMLLYQVADFFITQFYP